MKKQTCYPSSLSLPSPRSSPPPPPSSIPPSPPVLCWSEILEEQQAFPVCSGITVCDFSLTSQAALWHGGVIVRGGWKPFCHGRVEKDKAVPQPLCLAELRGLVSPPDGGYRLAHEWKSSHTGHGHFGFELTSGKVMSEHVYLQPEMSCLSLTKVNTEVVGVLVWFNGYNCPYGDLQCTGGHYDAGLT